MRFRFLLLLAALFAGVGIGYHEIAAQNIVTCPSLVQKAIESVGNNCGGLGRNNACYGYTDVNATFNNPQPSGYFTQPSQRASVPDLETLMTSPMNEALNKWGIALMSLQANLPDTLPGQNVVFMLVGDSQVENAVKPDDTFQGGKTLSVTLQIGANLYFKPDMSAQVVGNVPQGTALTADAVSSDGQWVRVAYGGVPGWLTGQVISADGDLTTLPVIGPDTKTPMQAFYFRTGISGTDCTQAPNALVVQGPKNLMIDIQANGANIRLGSTIVLYEIPVDPMTQQYLTDHYGNIGTVPELMQIVVLDGHVTLNADGPNPVVLTTGQTTFACLTQPENLGDDGLPNDRQVFNQCPWAAPRLVTEQDIEQFRYLQGVTLNYPIELPLELPPLTPTNTPPPTETFTPRPTRTESEGGLFVPTDTPAPTLTPGASATPWPTPQPTHKPTHVPTCPVNLTVSSTAALIAAINQANTCPSSSTITLSPSGDFHFAAPDNGTDGGNGLPVITSKITINGSGATLLPTTVLNARYFDVAAGGNLSINNLTMQNGGVDDINGGAILNAGTVTISNVTVTSGSAIDGGGLYNTGTANINHSTFSHNNATNGGGIDNEGSIHLVNVTIADNTAANGDEFYNGGGSAELEFTTLYGNSGGSALLVVNGGSLGVNNVINNSTTSGQTCTGSITATGANFTDADGCSGGWNVVGIAINDLANNGGSTETNALAPGSVAIDANDCSLNGGGTVTDDQRGVSRPFDGNGSPSSTECDSGAFEYNG